MTVFKRNRKKDISKVADCFHISSFVSDDSVMTDEGILGSIISIKGLDVSVMEDEQVRYAHASWHRAVQLLSKDCTIQVLTHRYGLSKTGVNEKDCDPGACFREEYESQLMDRRLYGLEQYLFLWCDQGRPIHRRRCWKKHTPQEEFLPKRLHEFDRLKDQFICQMKEYRCELLKLSTHAEQLLKVLSLVVNGADQEVRYQTKESLRQLAGSLSSLIAKRGIAIRDHIQFSSNQKCIKYGAVLSLAQYPSSTQRGCCDVLDKVQGSMIKIDTFQPLSQSDAVTRLSRTMSKYRMSDDKAKDHVEAIQLATKSVSQEEFTFGYHQQLVMVVAETREMLNGIVDRIKATYGNLGATVIEETLGLPLAFWGMCPGGFRYLSRLIPITSLNFVDFCSLHAQPQGGIGYSGCVNQKEPLALLKTRSQTAYRFNCHLKGSKTQVPVGHTLVLGGSGTGKTVFLSWLAAHLLRYKGRLYYFDRDHSAENYFKHLGALSLSIEPGSRLSMNPFSLEDSKRNRIFLTHWMQILCGDIELSDRDKRSLSECVDYAYDVLPRNRRYLSEVVRLLPVDFTGWDGLYRWLHSTGQESEGEYAMMFDHPSDQLSFSRLVYIDLSYVLDAKDPVLLRSVMMYLFHQVEQRFDGSLSSIILDEAWTYLRDPFWCEQLKQWLPTLRKRHAHVVMATQSASSISQSKVASELLDNLATAVYFRQPMANEKEYQGNLRLTKKEYQWVKKWLDPREILIKQNEESVIASVDVSGMKTLLHLLQVGKRNE